jgi:hypothetical protein
MSVYENLRTSILISILLIPTISLYSRSDTRGELQTKAAVGLGMQTSSTWTTLGTRTTTAHIKVPSAAFYECNLFLSMFLANLNHVILPLAVRRY